MTFPEKVDSILAINFNVWKPILKNLPFRTDFVYPLICLQIHD